MIPTGDEPILADESEPPDVLSDVFNESSNLDESLLDVSSEYTSKRHSIHGNIYQLKLLILFLIRGFKEEYVFRVAHDLHKAGKFDDIVIEYRNPQNEEVIRYLQAKHSQDESVTITRKDLLNEKGGDYSLQKYFASYCDIVREIGINKVNDMIICTNIDLNKDIQMDPLIPDKFLQMYKDSKPSQYYKLNNNLSECFVNLKETSDSYVLVNELHNRFIKKKQLTRHNILNYYHGPLSKEVLCISRANKKNEARFTDEFISGDELTDEAKRFRETYILYLKKRNSDIEMLRGLTVSVSQDFGVMFTKMDPYINDSEKLSERIARFIDIAKEKRVFEVSIKKEGGQGPGGVVKKNIHKLSGHVFVKHDEIIKMNDKFLDLQLEIVKMPRLKKFRDDLKRALQNINIEFSDLKAYRFNITKFRTDNQSKLLVKSSLPTDVIQDGAIHNFIKAFVLAVNQPNEVELGDIIKSEMRGISQFNTMNIDLVYADFFSIVLDRIKQKNSMYISHIDVKDFVNTIVLKVDLYISIGIGKPHLETLKKYNLIFETENNEIRDFLNTTNNNCLNVIASDLLLGSLMVLQVVNNFYGKLDSYILIMLHTFLQTDNKQRIMNALKLPESLHLLVLQIEDETEEKYIQNAFSELSILLNENNLKKVIFVSEKKNKIIKRLMESNVIQDCTVESDCSNLTIDSKYKILQGNVCFAEKQICLNRLLDEHSISIIPSRILTDILNDKRVVLNTIKEIPSDATTINFYFHNIQIDAALFTECDFQDIIAIVGENKNSCLQYFNTQNILIKIDEVNSSIKPGDIIYLESQTAQKKFSQLCRQCTNQNIHLFSQESNVFFWKETHGSISQLVKYRNIYDQYYIKSRIHQEDLFKSLSQVIIVSGPSGIGKSTFLNTILLEMQGSEQYLWTVKVNLPNYCTFLENVLSIEPTDVRSAINFVFNTFISSNLTDMTPETIFQRELFYFNQDKIVLLFDGYNEISSKYQDLFIALLRALRNSNIKKVYIVCGTEAAKRLEIKLDVFSYVFDIFSEQKCQVNIISKYWKEEINNDMLKKHCKVFINSFTKTICDSCPTIFSIPLHAKMIADCYLNDTIFNTMSEFISPKLPTNFNLFNFYSLLVKKNFNYFLLKNNLCFTNVTILYDEIKKSYIKHHQWLAMYSLLKNDELYDLFLNVSQINLYFKNSSGIVEPSDDKPYFIHKSYQDYFSASFVLNIITNLQSINSTLFDIIFHRILVERQYRGIRLFLSHGLRALSLVSLSTNLVRELQIDHVPESIVNIAAYENNIEIWFFIINYFKCCPNVILNLFYKSDFFNSCQKHFFAYRNNDLIIKLIIDNIPENKRKKFCTDFLNSNVDWHFSNLKVVEIMKNNGGDLNILNEEGCGLIHHAVLSNNLNLLKLLLENNCEVDSPDRLSETALYLAVSFPLQNDNLYNINTRKILDNNEDITVNLNILKLIIKSGANLNNKYENGDTILHVAVQFGKYEVVKYLVDNGCDISSVNNRGRTVLHDAVHGNHYDIVTFLIMRGANVNASTYNGETILHTAVTAKINIIMLLIKHRADVNALTKNGCSVLQSAIMNGRLSIVKCLLKHGANINAVNFDGENVLDCAISSKNNNIVKYLLDENVNVNAKNKNGVTILQKARSLKKYAVVKLLLEKGAVDCETVK